RAPAMEVSQRPPQKETPRRVGWDRAGFWSSAWTQRGTLPAGDRWDNARRLPAVPTLVAEPRPEHIGRTARPRRSFEPGDRPCEQHGGRADERSHHPAGRLPRIALKHDHA